MIAPGHYDQLSAGRITPLRLLPQVTCPHCWEHFAPEQVLWVSEHVDLLGDPLLGPERNQRFLPSRYTLEGDALDAKGLACRTMACPHCHLSIPRALAEMEPLFVSILGAPASGKSYLLTAMTWQLRKELPIHFQVSFTDAEPASNRALNECEESLFLNPDLDAVVPLSDLIRKTELQGELYDTVAYGHQTVNYPRPFLFTMQPQEHQHGSDPARLSRILCLYDNAGEHFQPGQDTAASPVTRHLARSHAIIFLFDPTQDLRFRAVCRGALPSGAAQRIGRLSRQETILNEAAARIRRHVGLSQTSQYDRPMVVILSKLDMWSHLLGSEHDVDPWRTLGNRTGIDVEAIEQRSAHLRAILLEHCPETVAAAEAFAPDVTYIAASALGSRVELDPVTGLPGIRPREIKPYWVTVPLLYSISQVLPALVPRVVRRAKPG
jgi:hypothetical protein